jgi:archaeal flagellar protein FlaJ
MILDKNKFLELRKEIINESKALKELSTLLGSSQKTNNKREKDLLDSQINSIKSSVKEKSKKIISSLEETKLSSPLHKNKHLSYSERSHQSNLRKTQSIETTPLEKGTIKRLLERRIKKEKEKKEKKTTELYSKLPSKFFSKISKSFVEKQVFPTLERDLIKANLPFSPNGYISIIFFATVVSFIASIFIMSFFLFFSVKAMLPFIVSAGESLATRIPKVIWIPIFLPAVTFLFAYFYPNLEKKSVETRINHELPFATINMSAISGSMIDPSKIFDIIISTKEYPNLEKEFKKLINEINVYGYDFVSALRNSSANSPSKKLSELFTGLATTINSGGDLPEFFEKRAQTLLFDHKIEEEKSTKAAETFMDIYISVVIAAPMILMLLLMMMKISGLGLQLSTQMITLIMVLGVSLINIVFITFLQLKKKN